MSDTNTQLQLDTSTPQPDEYIVQLRKGPLHGTEVVKQASVRTIDQVVNIVEGYRNHAVVSDQVTWDGDRVSVGFLGGLAPGGVVWEITVNPAVTVDA